MNAAGLSETAERVMFTRARLAELAGVRQQRLHYWERSELIRPAVVQTGRSAKLVRLYSYQDALVVLIIAALRARVTLQHIRQIVAHLRDRNFTLNEIKFAIAGDRVIFQTPDGEWEDGREFAQLVLHEVLDLQPLRAHLAQATQRGEDQYGTIEKRRGAFGSKPVIAGTRVPVGAVRSFLDEGSPTAEILEAYPSLTEADIEAVRALATA